MPPTVRTFPWWVILALVGLDYFSSLAYLPSLALEHAGKYAPLAALGVVAVTLLAAVPVYWYVVGRSPHGKGVVGLLEARTRGWTGKFLILVLLGFVATDYVLTRSVSTSSAATHLTANDYFHEAALSGALSQQTIRGWFPSWWPPRFFEYVSEQVVVTVLLMVLSFALYFWLIQTLTRGFTRTAVALVVLYLLLNAIVIGSAVLHLAKEPHILKAWFDGLGYEETGGGGRRVAFASLLWGALWGFPPLILGLSGFELSAVAAPMIDSKPGDDPHRPRGRIRGARAMMAVAAVIMCALLLPAIGSVSLLLDLEHLRGPDGVVRHRALAHIAHGGALADGQSSRDVLLPIFGPTFGTLYDLSSILVLILAGATAVITFRELVPEYLSRFGMQLGWARRIGVITHLFNGVILLVTVGFKASVEAQQWAYAASVLALLFGAALAALLGVRARFHRSRWSWPIQLPFAAMALLFASMGALLVIQRASGLGIALAFVLVVLVTAIVSRALRATEPRFDGFAFADEATRARWQEVNKLEFQVLVPHDPHKGTLRDKNDEVRRTHRLGEDTPIIFIEVTVGDPSEFAQTPLMSLVHEGGQEVIRVSQASSVAHAIAAVALSFRDVGRPPELHFAWSEQSAVGANIGFLLFGQGNLPALVRELIRKAEPDPARRPRVVVG